ncbi:MAG: MBL fold metallo-hydrolase [Chthonomonadales bacterium]
MATLSFWGGVGTVTGSKYLIEHGRSHVLVDCGMFQGQRELRDRNWTDPPFDIKKLTSVLLTHAHIDHTGYLPRLIKLGYAGSVYCSPGTAELLRILLPDAGRLQEEEADYRNRHDLSVHKPALPLYTEKDALAAIKHIEIIKHEEERFKIAPRVYATLYNAGHILGSRFALVELEEAGDDGAGRRILFSGDLGQVDKPVLKDPTYPVACDYLLVESTYGNRLHAAVDPKVELARVIHECMKRKGPLLIPAFAVGRTQELIYILRELEDEKKIPILPIRVDSPMAASATQSYAQRREEHDIAFQQLTETNKRPLRTHNMQITGSKEHSKSLNQESGLRIIISASGMMTGGRVLHHAMRVLPDPEATILFCGFQAAGTTGRRIKDGEPEVKIIGKWTPVKCHVEYIEGFSAHADWQGVIYWLKEMPGAPRRTFITHGEGDAAIGMAKHIEEAFGWTTEIPEYAEKFEIA